MPNRRRAAYETQEFRQRWFSDEPIQEIADDYGVTKAAVWRAAQRRGWPLRLYVRAQKQAA